MIRLIPPTVQTNRSPHGERGLKCRAVGHRKRHVFRSPHGERGLKYRLRPLPAALCSRSPHGERGLKSRQFGEHGGQLVVALLMESVD